MTTLLEFSHANLDTKVAVVKQQIFSVYYSPTHKCTMLLANAGAIIPVKESPDEVRKKMSAQELQEQNTAGNQMPQT